MPNSHQPCRIRSSTCPPWLRSALTEIEQRVRDSSVSSPDDSEPDSFAERAENYYRKRPQLISLLHDLHSRYLYLADRYSQQSSILKPHHISAVHSDIDDPQPLSDAESCISDADAEVASSADAIVADLVAATVDREILMNLLDESDRWRSDSAMKIELQRSLLEVLESERLVLLGENARLDFAAAAAAAEAGYTRRKALELARMLMKLRDDHRMCLLGRRMEGLQAQIYGLERTNRECFEAMARREKERAGCLLELDRLREENRRMREAAEVAGEKGRRKASRLWGRLRSFEWVPCGPQLEIKKGC